MTFRMTSTTGTAIAALVALALPATAQIGSDKITAGDLGVTTEIQAQTETADTAGSGDATVADSETGAEAGSPATGGDGTMMAQDDAATDGTFEDEQLDAFVTAAIGIADVRQEYDAKLASAAETADETELEALALEARTAMLAVIEETDEITLDEYTAIGTAAQSDPALAERLAVMMRTEMDADANSGS